MKRALITLLLCTAASAQAGTLSVSLDPLPYGAVQLAYGQYLIPNVNGMNVLLYSQAPLTFAQPGQAVAAKASLTLDPLPLGAIRMNDSQYMIPNAMPGVMAMVISEKPLNFAQTQLALAAPSVAPAPSTPVSPLTAAVPSPLTLVQPSTPPTPITAAPPAPVTPAPAAAPTPAPTPTKPAAPSAPLTVEVRDPNRLPRLPGLPEELSGNINHKEEAGGRVTITYSLTNLGRDTYQLKATDLAITQETQGVRARLDRRNGALTPGSLAPNKGEIGTITLNRRSSAPITLTWVIRKGGETYTLKYTVEPTVALKNN